MGWDGSGNFTRARNWVNDQAASINMLSANFDQEDDNFATGINACLTKNNETKPTADFRPNATRSYALGSTALRWTSLHLGTSVNVQSGTAAAATTIAFTDATSARTATFPDLSGTVAFTDATQTVSGFITQSGVFSYTPGWGAGHINNLSLTASVAGNALTVAVKTRAGADPTSTTPAEIAFRNATATTGDYSILQITAANSLTISSGSTLGTTSAIPARFWVVGFNDAGTFRLGLINCSTSTNVYPLADDMLASSTAEGGAGAADSAGVIYTGTAVTSKPMRVLGYIELTEATAGTYATSPSKVQLWTQGMKLPGDIVQIQASYSSSQTFGSTTIPSDDTIPQSTEGDQYFTVTITPTSAANHLLLSAKANYNTSAACAVAHAFFQDSTANALCAGYGTYASSAGEPDCMSLEYMMMAGTTSATTIKYKAGTSNASTFYINGNSGGRQFGGTLYSNLTIREIMS